MTKAPLLRTSVRTKLAMAIGALLTLLAISQVAALLSLRVLGSRIGLIAERTGPLYSAAQQMETDLAQTSFAVLGYLQDRDRAHLERIGQNQESFEVFQSAYADAATTLQSQELGTIVVSERKRFSALASQLISLEDEQAWLVGEFHGVLNRVSESMDAALQLDSAPGEQRAPSRDAAGLEMKIQVNGIARDLAEYLRSPGDAPLDRIEEARRDFESSLENLASQAAPQEQPALDQIHQGFRRITELVTVIVAIDEDKRTKLAGFEQSRAELSRVLTDQVQVLFRADLTASAQDASATIRVAGLVALVILGVAALVAILSWLLISRGVARPIGVLAEVAEAVGEGDLTRRAKISSGDEFQLLADTMNRMIVQRSRAEAELVRAHAELLRNTRLAAIGEFASSVAHGVRNPLAGIRAAAQLAQQTTEDASIAESLSGVIQEADRMDYRIRRLLDLSRPLEPKLQEADIGELLASVAHETEPRMSASNVKLELSLSDERVVWTVDARYLEEVLLELIENAMRAMPMPAGGKLSLHLEQEPVGPRIRIKDTGSGIPAGVVDRIFDLFFTTRDEGTGFGLASARRIVEALGGKIQLESTGDGGTEFSIRLE